MASRFRRRSLSAKTEGGVTVVQFTGPPVDLDERGSAALGRELALLVEGLGAGRLVLDFGNVASLSSLCLAVLLKLHKKAQAGGGSFVLDNLSPEVYEAFQITRRGGGA